MKKISQWITKNLGSTLLIVLILDALFLYALVIFCGCAPRPPRRFQDGDPTALGPPTHGEVIEPDMVKPEPEDID